MTITKLINRPGGTRKKNWRKKMNWNPDKSEKLVGKTATLKKDFWGRDGLKKANAGDHFKITEANVGGCGKIVSVCGVIGGKIQWVKLRQIKAMH